MFNPRSQSKTENGCRECLDRTLRSPSAPNRSAAWEQIDLQPFNKIHTKGFFCQNKDHGKLNNYPIVVIGNPTASGLSTDAQEDGSVRSFKIISEFIIPLQKSATVLQMQMNTHSTKRKFKAIKTSSIFARTLFQLPFRKHRKLRALAKNSPNKCGHQHTQKSSCQCDCEVLRNSITLSKTRLVEFHHTAQNPTCGYCSFTRDPGAN